MGGRYIERGASGGVIDADKAVILASQFGRTNVMREYLKGSCQRVRCTRIYLSDRRSRKLCHYINEEQRGGYRSQIHSEW